MPAKKKARGKTPFQRADGRDSGAMTQHERMKTACGRNSWVRQLSQARALSSSFSIAASTNTSSQSKTCACKKHDRHHHDASTAQKETETSTNTTRRAKFSKPPQRRTPRAGNIVGLPVSANASFTNFVTLLRSSLLSGAVLNQFRCHGTGLWTPK